MNFLNLKNLFKLIVTFPILLILAACSPKNTDDSKPSISCTNQAISLYRTLLNRNPDPGGFAYYKKICLEGESYEKMQEHIKKSEEYKSKN